VAEREGFELSVLVCVFQTTSASSSVKPRLTSQRVLATPAKPILIVKISELHFDSFEKKPVPRVRISPSFREDSN
jgi:hypothetical protein